jgi:small subunit ribosomal protein S27Ae
MMAKEKKKQGAKYAIEGEKIKRTKNPCPKCGPGTFLAEHKDRTHCGRCGYTKWKSKG